MCGTCGCNQPEKKLIEIEQDVMADNNSHAEKNRQYFIKNNILAINLLSSPGAGKTTLLEQTLGDLKSQCEMAVIEGDQQTDRDAQRIAATGAPVVQINTGKGCHLDAHRIGHALEDFALPQKSILFIENVGNLVCPALFDLGESFKVVILSVTEGEDKPVKYQDMFAAADLMVINKTDLLPYVEFSMEQCLHYAKQINPKMQILQLSATTGDGLTDWYAWLTSVNSLHSQRFHQVVG